MASITIEGKQYSVPNNFGQMSEAQRQEYIFEMLKNEQRANIASDTSKRINAVKERGPTAGEYAKGVTRAALGQGLLFGFGDELEAGLRSGFGLLGDYGQTVGNIRDDIKDFQKKAPGVSISSEIGGAIIPTVLAALATAPGGGSGGAAVGAGTAARIAARAPGIAKAVKGTTQGIKSAVGPAATDATLMQIAKQGAKSGAIYGGAYGAGTAEGGAYDRAMGALKGAAIGGATGGVVAPGVVVGGKGISKGLDAIKNMSSNQRTIDRIAQRKIAEKMAQDNLDSAAAQADNAILSGANRGSVTPLQTTLADAGENLQNLGFASKSIGNTSKNMVRDVLEQRQANSSQRIMDNLHSAAKTDPTKLSIDFTDDLARLVNAESGPAYKLAYDKTINAGKFKEIFMNEPRRDILLEAAKRGQEIMNAKGISVPNLANMFKKDNNLFFGSADDILAQDLPTQFYHAIKKGFDDIIDEGTTILPNMSKKYTEKAGAVIDLKNQFNKIIKDNNPAYAAANKQFADKARLSEAFLKGNKVNNLDIRQITKIFNDLSPGEQVAFKQGVMSHFQKLSEQVTEGTNFAARILANEKNKKLFELIMPGKNADEFAKYIKLERTANETRNKVMTGSRTQERQQAVKELEGGVVGEFIDRPTVMGLITSLGRKGLQYTQTGGPAKADAIAKRLFEVNPAEQRKILLEIQKASKEMAEEVAKRLQRAQKTANVVSGPLAVGVLADPNNQ